MNQFAEAATAYAERGFAVVPVDMRPGKETTKRPLIEKWPERRLSANALRRFGDRHPDAGIALNVGHSGLVLVDIDSSDPGLAGDVLDRFGGTQVKAQTPGGGWHGWFHDPEGVARSANLRASEGLPVDIKAGIALGIVPPTENRAKGGSYRPVGMSATEFPDALLDAPPIDHSGLPSGSADARCVGEGGRDAYALRNWRIMAANAATWERYLADSHAFNMGRFKPAWPAAEVEKRCRYWWTKKQCGELLLPDMGWNAAQISQAETGPLLSVPRALALWVFLRTRQPLQGEFHVAPESLARDHPGLGTTKTIRAALHKLLELEYLKLTYRGGRHRGDPSRYKFGPFSKGGITPLNRSNTLPPVVGQQSNGILSGESW